MRRAGVIILPLIGFGGGDKISKLRKFIIFYVIGGKGTEEILCKEGASVAGKLYFIYKSRFKPSRNFNIPSVAKIQLINSKIRIGYEQTFAVFALCDIYVGGIKLMLRKRKYARKP